MRRICVLVGIIVAGSSFAGVTERGVASERPNIVVILADDMGYGDCGVYNPESKIATPHIDQLAAEGLRFTDAHSAGSTCTPSRYGLLTGINPARTGVLNTLLSRGDPIIDQDETTIACLLKDTGYTTKMIGKWHLGFEMDKSGNRPSYDFSKPLKGGPLDRGFESFFGIGSSPGASPLCYIRGREVVALPTERGSWKRQLPGGKPVEVRGMMAPGFVQEEVSPSYGCRPRTGPAVVLHLGSYDRQPAGLSGGGFLHGTRYSRVCLTLAAWTR